MGNEIRFLDSEEAAGLETHRVTKWIGVEHIEPLMSCYRKYAEAHFIGKTKRGKNTMYAGFSVRELSPVRK